MNQTQEIETANFSPIEKKYFPLKKYRIKENASFELKAKPHWKLRTNEKYIFIESDDLTLIKDLGKEFKLDWAGEIWYGDSYLKNKILVNEILKVSEEIVD